MKKRCPRFRWSLLVLEAIAIRLEAMATRVEPITTRLEAIASRLEAIASIGILLSLQPPVFRRENIADPKV